MPNQGGLTTGSATTTPPLVPTTLKTHSAKPHASHPHKATSTTQRTGSTTSDCNATKSR